MKNLIDSEGMVFGVVNVVDALVVLLVFATVVAGAGVVMNDGVSSKDRTQETDGVETTVALEFTATQYVADAVDVGPVEQNENVVAIEEKSVEPRMVLTKTDDGELVEREHPRQKTVTVRVTLVTTEESIGVSYRGTPVRVGNDLTLDLGTVEISGTVTDVED